MPVLSLLKGDDVMGYAAFSFLFILAIGPLLVYLLAYFTVLIEKPVIIGAKITDNGRFVKSLNICTNVSFNMCTVLIFYLCQFVFFSDYKVPVYLWTAIAELLLIPFWEIHFYRKVSDKKLSRIVLFTYLANFLSFSLGFVVFGFAGKIIRGTILVPVFGVG